MFTQELGKRILFFDGAMGTLLQEKGLAGGELPDLWNLSHPDIVKDIHLQYLNAGADILKTNTFGTNALKHDAHLVDVIVKGAVDIAKAAVAQAGHGWVALDMGPTGKLLKPFGDLEFERAVELYAQVALAGQRAGADCILIETMADTYELKAAVLGAKETSLPVMATVAFDEKGKLLTGADIQTVVAMLEGLGVAALGLNCGMGPDAMLALVADLAKVCSAPIIVNPNAGLPRVVDGNTIFDVGPEQFARSMECICAGGAWLVGGCCGTTPAHIKALVEHCAPIKPVPAVNKARTVVSSGQRAVVMKQGTIIVGERINPTGKSKFKQALRAHNIDYILGEALTQVDNGADVLDINVGLPEIDEVQMMGEVVMAVQGVVDVPLQIDTSNIEAMERALRIYNGKALINSVNGKQESMDAIFPLVKKYGGVVVGLTLDEDGIPQRADARVDIARRIIKEASKYGIGRENIVIDALTMTISTGADNAKVTLEAMRRIKQELGVATTLGVSNISFGLPKRESINASFLAMAIENRLDAAIINPLAQPMMRAFRTASALMGYDENCARYIAYSADADKDIAAPKSAQMAQMGLREAVEKGLKDAARRQTEEMLRSVAPLDIINLHLMPALDAVGLGFEKGTLFLPQLLMSAEAAKEAFALIQERMLKDGNAPQKKGKIVLATVKGDIHDIGKNIVKVLLDNYAFEVIDLGRDVAPEKVLEAVRKDNISLVGLSALMTTTVKSMEETIALLHREAPGCRIMVGGAVLNKEYAQQIGADFYGKDAMASVGYAQSVFGDAKEV